MPWIYKGRFTATVFWVGKCCGPTRRIVHRCGDSGTKNTFLRIQLKAFGILCFGTANNCDTHNVSRAPSYARAWTEIRAKKRNHRAPSAKSTSMHGYDDAEQGYFIARDGKSLRTIKFIRFFLSLRVLFGVFFSLFSVERTHPLKTAVVVLFVDSILIEMQHTISLGSVRRISIYHYTQSTHWQWEWNPFLVHCVGPRDDE